MINYDSGKSTPRLYERARMAKRVSIINFKGGVGKTTLAFHLGTGLARLHHARVLLVDMDHQSSLSILCMKANGWKKAVNDRHLIDEIFLEFCGERHGLPGDEIIASAPMRDRDTAYNSMNIVPASLRLDDIEIELTASHQGNAILSEWNKRTMVCRWIEETGIDDKYDYIIFDCPPATKIVSQNAIAASHGYIIPVVPEAVMERGAPHLHEMMRTGIDDRLKALAHMGTQRVAYVPDTKLVGLVITRIQAASGGYTIDHRRHLNSLRRSWEDQLLTPYIEQGTGVSDSLTRGVPVYTRPNYQNITRRGIGEQFIEFTNEIKRRVDEL